MDTDKNLKIIELEEEIITLKMEGEKLRERLDVYLLKNKSYYNRNKEKCLLKVKEYQEKNNYKTKSKTTPEKRKEYARRAYLKKKEKMKNKLDKNIVENN